MRDANGFKQHTLSESHVRQMQVVGQNANKFINDYSNQFRHDFLQLLRTSHGEKKININHFYQEYIANKEHMHMNATKWPSLTEFAKTLGREGICRVEEGDRGLEIAWVDNTPEALRRQDAIRKRERQDRGDEEREQKLIQEQIQRARRDAQDMLDSVNQEMEDVTRELQREEGERISLDFGAKKVTTQQTDTSVPCKEEKLMADRDLADASVTSLESVKSEEPVPAQGNGASAEDASIKVADELKPETVKLSMGTGGKPKNVFAAASKRNALSSIKSMGKVAPQKPMSEAERIMREEIERKRAREGREIRGPAGKRLKI